MTTFTQHNIDAVFGPPRRPDRLLLTYATAAENTARGVPRTWLRDQPGCTAADRAAAEQTYGSPVACDEMPYYATSLAGPGASLRYIPAQHNSAGGGYQGGFTTRCYETRGLQAPGPGAGPVNQRVAYLVVPQMLGRTISWCSTP